MTVRLARSFPVAVLALAAAVGGASGTPGQAPQAPAPQVPSFRAGVDIVSLPVTVTDPDGQFVTDLDQEDFQVFEDGVKQDVTLFNRTNLPIALALLVDTSASMEARLPIAQEAAIGFARRLRPQDLARSHRLRQPRRSCSRASPASAARARRRPSAGPRPAGRRRCTTPSTSR